MLKRLSWIPVDKHPSGTQFLCPYCNGKVYYHHGSSSKSRRNGNAFKCCPYPFCPWCCEKVKFYSENEMEFEE